MIAIVNIGPFTEDHSEERTYEVRIKSNVIASFKHRRSDGLATCLNRAGAAVHHAMLMDAMQKIEALDD